MNKYRVMKKGGKSKRFPDLNKDGKITMADILKGRGVKRQAYGGKVEYGIGGAILGGLNALKAGKGLGGAAMAAGKGFITPGSGIAQGAKMAGGLLAGSNNPALAKLGGLAGAASSFLPGGGGPMAALGALPGLLGGQSAEYGMKVKKMEEGGESDPPRADFLLRGSAEEGEEGPTMIGGTEILGGNPLMGDLMATRLASETTQAGAGLSPIGYGELYSDEGAESSERSPQKPTDYIPPLRPKDPGPLPIDINPRHIKRDYPETPEEDSSFRGIYYNPTTSNLRTFIPTDDKSFDGQRTFGARGFEEEDRIPYGFMEDGKKVFATTAALDKMKEEGVGARGAAAEDYMVELYRSNPELFTSTPQGGQKSRAQMFQRVMEEAKQRRPGVPGFYIPTSPLKASF